MLSKGKLTSWNDDKGFGFITPTEGSKQIFIHITKFVNRSNTPTVGQTFISLTVITGKLPFEIFIIYTVLSLITYAVYAIDKSAAQSEQWKTPEQTLHVFALMGGWPGALLAQNKLRHKSSKESFRFVFRFVFRLTVILNIGLLSWLLTPYGSEYVQLIPRIVG